jgi:hypothetical protein
VRVDQHREKTTGCHRLHFGYEEGSGRFGEIAAWDRRGKHIHCIKSVLSKTNTKNPADSETE